MNKLLCKLWFGHVWLLDKTRKLRKCKCCPAEQENSPLTGGKWKDIKKVVIK